MWSAHRNLDDKSLSINKNFYVDTEFNAVNYTRSSAWRSPWTSTKKQVYLNEDTLYVNNISYFVDTIGNLPSDLHPKRLCEKGNEKCLVFGGMYFEYSKHSNWSASRFTFKEIRFECIEQGYMYNKAMINNEPETARKICYTTDLREIKRLGSSVSVTKVMNGTI